MRYILNGKTPVLCDDLQNWAEYISVEVRRVKSTVTKNGWISSVFLGVDYSFIKGGEPVLFETVIFYGPMDNCLMRCSTWDESEIQHDLMVKDCMRLKLRRKIRKKIKLQIRGTWCSTLSLKER